MQHQLTAGVFCAIIIASTSSTIHAQEPPPQRARDLSGVMTDLSQGNDKFVLDSSVRDKDRIELVMHRFLLGHYQKESDIDSDYRSRADQAAKLGIRFGAYQVPYLSRSGQPDGELQARDFLNQLASPNYCNPRQKLLLAIDWEHDKCYDKNNKKVSCGIVDPRYVAGFLNFVNNATHKKALVYVGPDVLSTYSSELQKEPIRATLTRNPLWLAQYETYYLKAKYIETKSVNVKDIVY